jgi:hypothetical protein
MIRVCRHSIRISRCRYTLQCDRFCHRCASCTRTNDLSAFKIGQVSCFPILSHGLPLNTIPNALTLTLQSVTKQKNMQCCQLKLFQCSQHKQILFLNFLVFLLFCSPPYVRAYRPLLSRLNCSVCIFPAFMYSQDGVDHVVFILHVGLFLADLPRSVICLLICLFRY